MTEIEQVAGILAEEVGQTVTTEQALAYLGRRGISTATFLAEHAAFLAKIAQHVEPPVPDPQREPAAYAAYLHQTNPQG